MDPSSPAHRRHLAAVWFADLVGYGRLADENEDHALRVIDLFQRHASTIVAEHDGRLVKWIGDAAIAEFSSTDAAAQSALGLVTGFAEICDVELRVGLHLGDVARGPDGDIFGDGVNLASRLQTEAEPGQILISEDAWHQLRHREGYRFQPMGERIVKGRADPVRIHAMRSRPTNEEGGTDPREGVVTHQSRSSKNAPTETTSHRRLDPQIRSRKRSLLVGGALAVAAMAG